jgi:hypothetical protein
LRDYRDKYFIEIVERKERKSRQEGLCLCMCVLERKRKKRQRREELETEQREKEIKDRRIRDIAKRKGERIEELEIEQREVWWLFIKAPFHQRSFSLNLHISGTFIKWMNDCI